MTSGEVDKLRILLDYWIEHNREHSQEFREWAEKADSLGVDIGGDILQAANEMDKASEILSHAQRKLREKEG